MGLLAQKLIAEKSKGDIKSHQKSGLEMSLATTLYIHHASKHDLVLIQNKSLFKENKIGVFSKAYNKYSAFEMWNTQNTFFVSRYQNNAY